jgi:dihydrodipicolinate synthase/N-acetylneuraminate lyase
MKRATFALDGITPIVNTPFTDDLAIDYASLERLVDRALADGAVGLVVPAVASEVDTLSPVERRQLLGAVVERVAGKATVIAGVSSPHLDESVRLAEDALALGVNVILCRVPEELVGDPDRTELHFAELAKTGMSTLMIQDLQWNGPGLPIDSIVRLYEAIPAFTAIKVETVPAGRKYSAILDATRGGLHVSCGWGLGQMIEALDRGVSTFTTTAINLPFVEVHRAYRDGDRARAYALFNEISPMLLWCQQHIDISIPFLKRYAVAAGLFTTPQVRIPARLDHYAEHIGDELIALTLSMESRLRREREETA